MSQFFRNGLAHDYEDGGVYKVLLVGTSYTHDPDNEFVTDISADELSGTGYSRETVTPTESYDDVADERSVSIGNQTWTGADFGEVKGRIIYKEVTDDTDSPVLIYNELTESQVTNGGDFTFNEASEGAGTIAL